MNENEAYMGIQKKNQTEVTEMTSSVSQVQNSVLVLGTNDPGGKKNPVCLLSTVFCNHLSGGACGPIPLTSWKTNLSIALAVINFQ